MCVCGGLKKKRKIKTKTEETDQSVNMKGSKRTKWIESDTVIKEKNPKKQKTKQNKTKTKTKTKTQKPIKQNKKQIPHPKKQTFHWLILTACQPVFL